MPILEITDFSCIRGARIELKPITLLIGPQASGKSVITKLCYFFTDILHRQFDFAEDGVSLERFKVGIISRFEEWFPPSAWGKKPFRIVYRSGDELTYTISRGHHKKKKDSEIDVEFSPFFDNQYRELLKRYEDRRKEASEPEDDDFFGNRYERLWRVRSSAMKLLADQLGDNLVRSQTFIPAGRSFFTNLGKAVAMLEHGTQMDEVTRGFGRLFTYLLDGRGMWWTDKPDENTKNFLARQKVRLDELFGGKIKIAENDRHVATDDGRKIPFSILSSGQQELLPLLLILQHKARQLSSHDAGGVSEIIYVEEPEAHLFPEAQGDLVEYIAALSAFFKGHCLFLITTHSPYVISKFNNLIKAFTVAKLGAPEIADRVAGIVAEDLWLPPASVNAYALSDGMLKSVHDRSGLIDGDYLDGISEDISETFLELLEAETVYDRERMSLTQGSIENKVRGK